MALMIEVEKTREVPAIYGDPNTLRADLKRAVFDLTPEQAEYVLKRLQSLKGKE